ncbi:hypothetical protein NIES1031_05320 [Chroogloeocystis siderophila 5.2 s.c.1]|uniref:Carbohydrate kinase FGGY N-terminal domain-containing protein n=2 Tax=Chroogloeocystis TaxID=329162 RepID=A0A1U7HWS3_9CHRO|nr:hypothetical protein NIES1031_05320 [Chroogloeocystis siderophila 5.2 s.c.1]
MKLLFYLSNNASKEQMTLSLVDNNVAISIDFGTSGVRVVAVTLQCAIAAQARRSYPLLTPHRGWTEQNPSDWVEAAFQALTEVVQQLQDYHICMVWFRWMQ